MNLMLLSFILGSLVCVDTYIVGKRCSGVSVQDVVFVIDASGSIGHSNFQLIREFTTNITTALINNSPRSAVGVILFGDTAYIKFNLQAYTSLNTLISAINQLPYDGGSTHTARALTLLLLTAQNGKLGLRSDSSKVAIVITDGKSSNPSATLSAAAMLHESDLFDVFVVGIHSAYEPELEGIASSPEYIFYAKNFSSIVLQQVLSSILPQLCKAPTPRIFLRPNYLQQGIIGEGLDLVCSVAVSSTAEIGSINLIWNFTSSDNRVTVIPTNKTTDLTIGIIYTTVIQFGYLMEEDKGNYLCTFSVERDSTESTFNLQLIRACVNFSQSSYFAMESSKRLQGAVVSSRPLQTSYQIKLKYVSGNATSGEDFAEATRNVKFNQGNSVAKFTIPIIKDRIFEGTEVFTIQLVKHKSAKTLNIEICNPSTAIGHIIDKELALQFSQSNFSGFEKSGIIPVTLILRGGITLNKFTVTVVPSDQSPVSAEGNGVDYTSTPIIATFAANTTSTTINVPITKDNIAEQSEMFDLTFIIPPSLSSQVIPKRITKAIGVITDDTNVTVTFNQSTYSVNEDAGTAQLLLMLSNPSSTDITVVVYNTNGTAFGGGIDYSSGPYTVIFSAGQTHFLFNVPLNNDGYFEGNENFVLTINSSSLLSHVTPGNPSQAIVTIWDNDVPKVHVDNITVYENDGTVNISVEINGPPAKSILMNVVTVDGTAYAGRNYMTVSQEITFLSNQSEVFVRIPLLDNTFPRQPDLFFYVDIVFNRSTIARSVITIIDNDYDLIVEFSSSSYIGSESLKGVPVTLVITKGAIYYGEHIVFNIVATSHSPISAEGCNKDFSSVSVPVTFTYGTNRTPVIIPVFQDKIIENVETFDVHIDIPSRLTHRISPGRQRKATASIIDSTIISCPPNFEAIAMQKATTNTVVRKEIRSTIKNVLNLTENVVVDKEAFTKLSAKLDIENSTEYFVQFQNAINEISETSYEACYGSKDKLAYAEEIPVLIGNFKKIVDSESSETRYIFGRLLCLHQKFQTNSTLVTKRELTYPEVLEMWFNELEVKQFHKLFNFTPDYLHVSLAFVVDNTGSMSQEIKAVKDVIKAIIKAERTSPFFYILGTFNDPDVGEAKKYFSDKLIDLHQLKNDVETIFPDGGGDCRELGMEGILRALDLSHEDSNIIVLTDASCKDCERSHEVVRIARLLKVKIHFFLNGYGCGLDNFPNYTYVQQATEGISVNSIESFRSLSLFISGLRQEVLTPGKRSTHYTAMIDSSSEKCQTFNVSIFTVKFKLIVNKKSKFTKINDPLGYSVKAQHINDDYSGYDTDGQPRNGSWTVCTVDDSPIFTITKRDLLDFAVDYYQDGYYSSAIPTAETVSILSVFSTQLDNILIDGNITLSFISEDNEFVGSTPLIYCSGYLLGRIVIPNVNFVYQISGNDKFGNPFVHTKRSSINIPGSSSTTSSTDPPTTSSTDPPTTSSTDSPTTPTDPPTTDPPTTPSTDPPTTSTDPPTTPSTDPPTTSSTDPPTTSSTDPPTTPTDPPTTDPPTTSSTDPPTTSTTDPPTTDPPTTPTTDPPTTDPPTTPTTDPPTTSSTDPPTTTTDSPTTTPSTRKPYVLENILDGSGNKTINIGSKASVYFSLMSANDTTKVLSFIILASTSPTELMLKHETTITVKPNDAEIIIITIDTRNTDMPGSYVVKVTASSGDLILTNSQNVTLVKQDDSSCPCLNGGTCEYSTRRGRTIIYCHCPTGYIGNRCQIRI